MQNEISRRQALVRFGSILGTLAATPVSAKLDALGAEMMNAGFGEKDMTEDNNKILYRAIPGSGEGKDMEHIPVLGLGTWKTFDCHSPDCLRMASSVTSKFLELGGRVIDTSPMYGKAEETIGKLSPQLSAVRDVFIATKVWTRGAEAGIKQIRDSFALMKRPVIDLIQVHNLVDYPVHMKTLQELRASGKIRYTGITHYMVSAFDDMMAIMKKDKPDFIQIPFSIMTRQAENKILPLAMDLGIAVLVNRPFEEGAIFKNWLKKPLPSVASEIGANTWASYFLKYIVAHPAVTCVIPSTTNLHHLEENMSADNSILPDQKTRQEMVRAMGLK